jgi:5-(carboxyamino)imidazole ribonucleotide synthase
MPDRQNPILPGSYLGILGGGQLGRMFTHAAQAMGYKVCVLDPDANSPAGIVQTNIFKQITPTALP